MSEPALDLRRSAQIVRRHRILVGVVAALGILLGGAYAALKPQMLTSTALVVLPQSVVAAQSANTANGVPDPYTTTQEVLADSDRVLSAALPNVRPAMSRDELRGEILVGSLTPYIISISAKNQVAANAEATANAVARSYIHYIGSTSSPVGQVSARLLESTNATAPSPIKLFIIDVLVGAVVGALIGVVIALAIGRNDRRLQTRDQVADSIGLPVLASIPVGHPSDAAGWVKLLEDYEPGALDGWRLRKALHQLGLGASVADPTAGRGSSLAVLSLSSDRNALALGPQLAVFAASLGIPVALVIRPQQDEGSTATLRTACAAASTPLGRSKNLWVSVEDPGHADHLRAGTLTVVVAVVDGQVSRSAGAMGATATVLGVTAGAATAEQLARVAASAAADGIDIAGILMADPDSADQTTGRLPNMARSARRRMPTRMTGVATETRQ